LSNIGNTRSITDSGEGSLGDIGNSRPIADRDKQSLTDIGYARPVIPIRLSRDHLEEGQSGAWK
jgi:hypothetical protein